MTLFASFPEFFDDAVSWEPSDKNTKNYRLPMKLYSEHFSLPIFPRRILAIAAFALCSGNVLALDPFTVKDIRIEGIQRTEAGTVFSYLPVRVGETYTDEKGIAAIKALYATGFFKDVRVEVEGNVLVIMVEERPAIAAVDFSGIKE